MHGKVTGIRNNGTGLFEGLPEKFKVTRYHSLVVREDSIPEEYRVDAVASRRSGNGNLAQRNPSLWRTDSSGSSPDGIWS